MHPVPIQMLKKYVLPLMPLEEHLNFKRGQVLFYKGHRPYGLYIIRSGSIEAARALNDVHGLEKKILGPGEVLGENELQRHEPFEFSARALEDSMVVFLPKSAFAFDSPKSRTAVTRKGNEKHENHYA